MARYRELLSLTLEQREELNGWAQSRSLPAGDVFRSRLILALADGMTYRAIKQKLHTTAPTIARWKQRFEEFGMAGLEPQHKGSRPRTATPPVQAKVCRKVQQRLERWQHALVGSQVGCRNGGEQIERAPHLDAGTITAASAGALYGE